ncbi:hypothetical protein [Winogradskyella forsetii]|uniref:hypothetical protein n=1 Tax=Winogradskyella forsetii TaxID=2686077 RepID=UPI0015BEE7F7|nr:hypothetical protein [Winogradskyella forsetii]
MKRIIFFMLLLINVGCRKDKPNIIGKWKVVNSNFKSISVFKSNGIVFIEYYDLKANRKLSSSPIELQYCLRFNKGEWFIDFKDTVADRELTSRMKLINNDTLVTYSKEVTYTDNDSIVGLKKMIHVRVLPY